MGRALFALFLLHSGIKNVRSDWITEIEPSEQEKRIFHELKILLKADLKCKADIA